MSRASHWRESVRWSASTRAPYGRISVERVYQFETHMGAASDPGYVAGISAMTGTWSWVAIGV